jgi:hypothetical protein
MNKELRKAIYNTQMLRNKYEKYHRQNMGDACIQKTTKPCYNVEKNQSEHIFREVYSQAILVKSGQQKMFLMENDVILNDKTDIW